MLTWRRSAHETAVWQLLKRTGIRVVRGRFTDSDASLDAEVPGTPGSVRELMARLEAAGIRASTLQPESSLG
jgi:hypothetical protein